MHIYKLLKDAFEAGENYAESKEMAFASVQPNFEDWFASIEIEPELSTENPNEIVNLVRFVIKNWASLNEQNEPDHEDLIQDFIKTDLAEYFETNQTNL